MRLAGIIVTLSLTWAIALATTPPPQPPRVDQFWPIAGVWVGDEPPLFIRLEILPNGTGVLAGNGLGRGHGVYRIVKTNQSGNSFSFVVEPVNPGDERITASATQLRDELRLDVVHLGNKHVTIVLWHEYVVAKIWDTLRSRSKL